MPKVARHTQPLSQDFQLPSGPSSKGSLLGRGGRHCLACSQGRPSLSQRRRRSQTCGRAVEAEGPLPAQGRIPGHCPHIHYKHSALFPEPLGVGRGGGGLPFPQPGPANSPDRFGFGRTQRPPVRQQPGARFLSWLSQAGDLRGSSLVLPRPGRPGQGSTLPNQPTGACMLRGGPTGRPRRPRPRPASPTRPPKVTTSPALASRGGRWRGWGWRATPEATSCCRGGARDTDASDWRPAGKPRPRRARADVAAGGGGEEGEPRLRPPPEAPRARALAPHRSYKSSGIGDGAARDGGSPHAPRPLRLLPTSTHSTSSSTKTHLRSAAPARAAPATPCSVPPRPVASRLGRRVTWPRARPSPGWGNGKGPGPGAADGAGRRGEGAGLPPPPRPAGPRGGGGGRGAGWGTGSVPAGDWRRAAGLGAGRVVGAQHAPGPPREAEAEGTASPGSPRSVRVRPHAPGPHGLIVWIDWRKKEPTKESAGRPERPAGRGVEDGARVPQDVLRPPRCASVSLFGALESLCVRCLNTSEPGSVYKSMGRRGLTVGFFLPPGA